MNRTSTLLLAVVFVACGAPQSNCRAADEASAKTEAESVLPAEYLRSPELPGRSRSPIYGRSFAASSGQPAATSAGMKVLRSGGNAADAAVTMAIALSVLEPMRSGPGGDVSILYWDAKGKRLYGLESAGRVPKELATALSQPAATDNAKADDDQKKPNAAKVPPSGPLTWTTPGAVDGWSALHSRFGSMPWEEVCGPAIYLATNGFVITPLVASDWNEAASVLTGPGAAALKPSETPLVSGMVVANADYARTLQTLAAGGRDSFYEGDLGQTLVAFGRGINAALSLDDLAKHQTTWHEPISINYRDTVVSTLPVSDTGVSMLETLGLLAAYDLKGMGRTSAQYWHLLLEAKRLSVADVMALKKPELGSLLAAERLAARRREIDPNKASSSPAYAFETTSARASSLVVTDASGNVCVLVQDLGRTFGSGIVPGAMGFVMQGRAAGLDVDRLGRRLPHSRTLAAVADDGQPFAYLTSDSGAGATELMAQTVTSLVDFASDAQTAIDRARLIEIDTGKERTLVCEPGIAAEAIEKLRGRGHVIARPTKDSQPVDMGEVHLIVRPKAAANHGGKSVISAGSDPRRDSSTLAE